MSAEIGLAITLATIKAFVELYDKGVSHKEFEDGRQNGTTRTNQCQDAMMVLFHEILALEGLKGTMDTDPHRERGWMTGTDMESDRNLDFRCTMALERIPNNVNEFTKITGSFHGQLTLDYSLRNTASMLASITAYSAEVRGLNGEIKTRLGQLAKAEKHPQEHDELQKSRALDEARRLARIAIEQDKEYNAANEAVLANPPEKVPPPTMTERLATFLHLPGSRPALPKPPKGHPELIDMRQRGESTQQIARDVLLNLAGNGMGSILPMARKPPIVPLARSKPWPTRDPSLHPTSLKEPDRMSNRVDRHGFDKTRDPRQPRLINAPRQVTLASLGSTPSTSALHGLSLHGEASFSSGAERQVLETDGKPGDPMEKIESVYDFFGRDDQERLVADKQRMGSTGTVAPNPW